MHRTIRSIAWRTLPVLLVALVIAACTDRGSMARLTGPEEASFARKSSTEQRGKKSRTVTASNTGRSWRLATGILPDTTNVKDEKIIDSAGGMIQTAGHVLYVPQGAVLRPTKFKIQASKTPVDSTAGSDPREVLIQVGLKAYEVDEAGNEIADVGALGFRKPVYLGLSYGWVSDGYNDPSKAKVLWMKSSTDAEETRTFSLDYQGRWIVAELNHFSIYTLGWGVE